jgi:DNA polymerase (family 10)
MMNLKLSTIFANMAELSKNREGSAKTVIDFTRAARSIRDFPGDLEEAYQEGALKNLPGIIPEMYALLSEYFEKSRIKLYEQLKGDYSEELIKFIRISGLGKKRIFAIYDILGAKDLTELKEKIDQEDIFKKILGTPNLEEGLINKTHLERLVHSLDYYESSSRLFPKGYIDFFISKIITGIKGLNDAGDVVVTGSLRRKKPFVGDIDLLAVTKSNTNSFNIERSTDFLNSIKKLPFIISSGEPDLRYSTLSERFKTSFGIDIEVIVTSRQQFAADLFYTTGSKSHIKSIEELASSSGQINGASKKTTASGSNDMRQMLSDAVRNNDNISMVPQGFKNFEEGQDYRDYCIYEMLGIEYVPPELRENKGELSLAQKFMLPKLVRLKDIKGDLHVHSSWSDGLISIDDIKDSCRKLGYEYLAISDHSVSNTYGNGLDNKRMLEKIESMKKLKKEVSEFELLIGAEIDIKGVSLLDYDEAMIKRTDIALASMHSNYLNSSQENTSRIISALENPLIDAIAHPTGLVFGARAPYVLDMESIFKAAAKYNKALEINSYLLRLDLNDSYARELKSLGGKVVINTDSHRPTNLAMIYLGVEVARRAGLEKEDIINTMALKELKRWKSRKS